MADNAKKMRWTLPEGGTVGLEWPDSISLESLEMVEEVLALQLRSVRRAIERKKINNDGVPGAGAAMEQPK